MQRTKALILLLLLALLLQPFPSCIKPFNPEIESGSANQLVVSGKITGTEGWQEVNVSMSSQVEDAHYNAVSGCLVNIHDNAGNIFAMEEKKPGSYQAWIGQEYLVTGRAYKVSVVTPDGDRIDSGYDTLTIGAALDSVYYEINNLPTTDPDIFNQVMQFYVDLNGQVNESRFYKWEVKETWEYHSRHALEYYYNGKFHVVSPPDLSKMVCWTNMMVKDIFLVSTNNTTENVVHKQPLHAIDGHSSRLSVLYSILVTQQSLTESTYNYFDVIKSNSGGFGGLYEQQPFSIQGNLVNLTRPEKNVLGYFYACSETSRRYFYQVIEGLEMDFWDNCTETPLPLFGWTGYQKYQYPIYYYYLESGELRILSAECIDCRVRGGTTTKPEYWPQ